MAGRSEKNPRPARHGKGNVATVAAGVVGVVLFALLVVCLPQFLADYTVVKTENETLHAENQNLSADLEKAKSKGGSSSESTGEGQSGSGTESAKPYYVIAVHDVIANVAVNGDALDIAVRARIYNDSSVPIDEGVDLPVLVFGSKEYKGHLTTDKIEGRHGLGAIEWEIAGVPFKDASAFLRGGAFSHIYYSEKIIEKTNDQIAVAVEKYSESIASNENNQPVQGGEQVANGQ